MVGIITETRIQACSGILISRQAVFTAATCIVPSESALVFLGAQNLNDADEPFQVRLRIPSSYYRIHPGYNRGSGDEALENNIAVIRLPHPIGFFTPYVNIVRLPTESDFSTSFVDIIGIIVG